MKLSSISYNRDNIKDANDIYKTFIVGSDIVWGMNITGNDFTYFLDFTDENKKRIFFHHLLKLHGRNNLLLKLRKIYFDLII